MTPLVRQTVARLTEVLYASHHPNPAEPKGIDKPAGNPKEERIRATFFWPFSGAHNIFAWRREAPSHALVCGNTKDYFRILAHDTRLPPETLRGILSQAQGRGFETNRLIWVRQAP